MNRIHIVGSGPRTGTTLIAEAMIACFEIDIYTEHEDRIFKRPPGPGEIFLTKCPQDVLVVGPMLRVDPDLFVICMIRDPRDSIVSKHGADKDKYWCSLRFWKAYTPYWRRIRNHPRCITVRYEEFVSDPDKVQATLQQRMPFLKWRAPFSRYHEICQPSQDAVDALNGVRPISPAGLGNWRKHPARIAGQIARHGSIADDLIEFGYAQDSTWERILDGVVPDMSASHCPEYFTAEDIRERRKGVHLEVLGILLRRVRAMAVNRWARSKT